MMFQPSRQKDLNMFWSSNELAWSLAWCLITLTTTCTRIVGGQTSDTVILPYKVINQILTTLTLWYNHN